MDRIKNLFKADQPIKWLFYGDSITHGATHTFGQRDYTQLFAERIRAEMGRPMDVVINTAISGNTTLDLLESFDWRVAQFQPHVVFLMIGMNDCSDQREIGADLFEKNLIKLVEKVESIRSQAVLQTTCPVLPRTSPDREPHFDLYMDKIRRVAGSRGLPLIDHTRYWKDHADKHFFWMSNAFHPNAYGHRAFATLLYRELDICDPESRSCGFYIP